MLDTCFSHLYFCESLPTLQHSLSMTADLLVFLRTISVVIVTLIV